MRIQAMKVYHLPRGLIWDHEPPSLTLGCKRLHPLAAVADTLSTTTTTTTASTFDLKSFIKPDCSPRTARSSNAPAKESPKAEAAPSGGTRWNPTQEQIGILEMHYKSGVRSPDTQLIKRITAQLSRYGKIEGKNVFYWFQNHKARERQKQKRASNIGLSNSPTKPFLSSSSSSSNKEEESVDNNRYKRKCMSWGFDELLEEVNKYCIEEEEDRTLKLFPLHPEGRSSLN